MFFLPHFIMHSLIEEFSRPNHSPILDIPFRGLAWSHWRCGKQTKSRLWGLSPFTILLHGKELFRPEIQVLIHRIWHYRCGVLANIWLNLYSVAHHRLQALSQARYFSDSRDHAVPKFFGHLSSMMYPVWLKGAAWLPSERSTLFIGRNLSSF